MAAYLEYVQVLKESFDVFELVYVPREQNARAYLLVKLASSGKWGRQRTVIQETLKTPRTVTDKMAEIQHVDTSKGMRKSHQSLTQETVKTPRISRYPVVGMVMSQAHHVEEGETWMTAYQRYLADRILPLDPI